MSIRRATIVVAIMGGCALAGLLVTDIYVRLRGVAPFGESPAQARVALLIQELLQDLESSSPERRQFAVSLLVNPTDEGTGPHVRLGTYALLADPSSEVREMAAHSLASAAHFYTAQPRVLASIYMALGEAITRESDTSSQYLMSTLVTGNAQLTGRAFSRSGQAVGGRLVDTWIGALKTCREDYARENVIGVLIDGTGATPPSHLSIPESVEWWVRWRDERRGQERR